MKLAHVYAVGAVVGAVLPLSQFAPWALEHGLNVPLLWQAATANPISAFAWLDVVVSALVLTVFMVVESQRMRMAMPWVALLALFGVGVSLGLPLFLWMRERHLSANTEPQTH